jgi:hypothetical protein
VETTLRTTHLELSIAVFPVLVVHCQRYGNSGHESNPCTNTPAPRPPITTRYITKFDTHDGFSFAYSPQ